MRGLISSSVVRGQVVRSSETVCPRRRYGARASIVPVTYESSDSWCRPGRARPLDRAGCGDGAHRVIHERERTVRSAQGKIHHSVKNAKYE